MEECRIVDFFKIEIPPKYPKRFSTDKLSDQIFSNLNSLEHLLDKVTVKWYCPKNFSRHAMNLAAIQRRTAEILDKGESDDLSSKICDWSLMALVLVNIGAIILESVASIYQTHRGLFESLELFSVVVFSVEYLLRLWSAPLRPSERRDALQARRSYCLSFHGLVDLIAIAPFYLQAFFPGADLRVLRIFRLVRVLKISHYSTAIEDLFEAIYQERKSFIAALYLLLLAVLLTSSLMYFAESEAQPDKFSSIPASMYWSIITLTTVGYGDVSPVTWVGQIIAPLTAFLGVCTVALLTGIVASAFSNQMARRKVIMESQIRESLKDGVLSKDEVLAIEALRNEFNLSEDLVQAFTAQVQKENAKRKTESGT